jgi:anti-sigma factor ChrR (cupin superfamily)
MLCKNLRRQLSLFANGDLVGAEAQAVQQHVALCPTCRQSVQQFQKTRTILGSLSPPGPLQAPPGSFLSGVMGRLGKPGDKPGKGRGIFPQA